MDSKTETVSDREIAKFMNINLTFSFGMFWVVDDEGEMPDYKNGTVYSPSTNWNQLMSVVKKIYDNNPMAFKVDLFSGPLSPLATLYIHSPIEDVYREVVKYIRWYNSQSPDTIK